MNWIKQNVGLVVGCVIALVLMCVAGWYMMAQIDKDKSITTQLDSQRQLVKGLYTRDPHPGTSKVDNIGAVKKEQERVGETVLGPMESYFPGFQIPTDLSISSFKEILENTVSELQRDARYTGISLPSTDQGNYGFSFDDIRPRIDIEVDALRPLTFQLYQVRELCEVLFEAKIHGINAIKRLPVSDNDAASAGTGSSFGMASTSSTTSSATSIENYIEDVATQDPNINAIMMPYQISFQCFSSELGRVMDGFNKSEHFFRIKWLAVEQGETSSSTPMMSSANSMEAMYGLAPPPPAANSQSRYGLGAGGASRYGGASPYGGMSANQNQGPEIDILEDLDEKPLTVNMMLVGIAVFPEEDLDSLMPLPSDEEEDDGAGAYGY
jgi:hypothetical protein